MKRSKYSNRVVTYSNWAVKYFNKAVTYLQYRSHGYRILIYMAMLAINNGNNFCNNRWFWKRIAGKNNWNFKKHNRLVPKQLLYPFKFLHAMLAFIACDSQLHTVLQQFITVLIQYIAVELTICALEWISRCAEYFL